MKSNARFNIGYLIFAVALLFLLQDLWLNATKVETIPYSRFQELLEQDRIEELLVSEARLSGTIRNPSENERPRFTTIRVDQDLAEQLQGKNIEVTGVNENNIFSTLLSWVLPALVFIGIWLLIMRMLAKKGGMGGSFMTVGKSKAKIYVEDDTKKTFADVAGIDEAKEELSEVVSFLKEPEKYTRLGARMPKGILLVGPPGTGKTLLARAVAGEAGVPFFSISGSEFVEMFVGVGAARVRDLFEQARTRAPCIIFIDELDALGKARSGKQFGNDEKEQTLNQLLVELDGFDARSGIVLLSATNRPEILDPALLRAGRFDRQVLVDRPDKGGRIAILRVHLQKIHQVDPKLDLEAIASMTTGFSGADLENLVNEATLVATRKQAEQVSNQHFNEAIERIVAGLERKNRILNERERQIVAYHEIGHAILGSLLPMTDKLHKVSIIPRGVGALGYTIQRPLEDRFLMTKEELEAKIIVLLGGRAAEELIFDHLSTGAADDISKVTNIARSMVNRYGMCREVGFISYDEANNTYLGDNSVNFGVSHSQETAHLIDSAVRAIVDKCYHRAQELLEHNRDILEVSAKTLLARETLEEVDLNELFQNLKQPAEKPV
ncbi:MAG: ATP-dependent zinc metalloprotease FtsH [Oligoflexus sp.]